MEPVRLTLSSPTQTFSHLTEGQELKIGRSETCDFVIPKDDLSREHCLFEIKNGEYFITDLGSKNGIYIDRIKIKPNVPVKVTESSLIVLANIYTLKINATDATKIGVIAKPANDKTVTFALDISDDVVLELDQAKKKKKT